MLVKPHELFGTALNMKFALGAFNTSNLELTQAIVTAAENQKAPVIAQTSESAITYAGLDMIATIVHQLAERASVPVVLHLDHGKSPDIAKQCIDAGFTSVMIDASKEPYDRNVAHTKEVVDYAHQRGVWVEGELGAILGAEGAQGLEGSTTPEDMMTKPDQAKEFVELTGIDALAVSVGTIHGAFSGQEYIRFELLQEIEEQLPGFPLVIHGASGIAPEHLEQAAQTNVCKVNVDTEMRIAFRQAVEVYVGEKQEKLDPRKLIGAGRDAVQAVVEEKIKTFGSAGKTQNL